MHEGVDLAILADHGLLDLGEVVIPAIPLGEVVIHGSEVASSGETRNHAVAQVDDIRRLTGDVLLGHLGHELRVGENVTDQIDLDVLALLFHGCLEAGDLLLDEVDTDLLGLHDRNRDGAIAAAAASRAGGEPTRGDHDRGEGCDFTSALHCGASLCLIPLATLPDQWEKASSNVRTYCQTSQPIG